MAIDETTAPLSAEPKPEKPQTTFDKEVDEAVTRCLDIVLSMREAAQVKAVTAGLVAKLVAVMSPAADLGPPAADLGPRR